MKDQVKSLLVEKPFGIAQEEKEKKLLPILKESLLDNVRNAHMAAFYKKSGMQIDRISSLEEIPFVHASAFKTFNLSTVADDKIVRVLSSSATTGQIPSKVTIDKETALAQSIALKSILSDYLGKKRMPLLVFDVESTNSESQQLAARGVGIRGFSNFANETYYLLKEENGNLCLDRDLIKQLSLKYENEQVFMFGFTYLFWETLSIEKKEGGIFKKMKVFHGGGWKRLESKKVSKDAFNKKVSEYFGCSQECVYDFYGMVEAAGLVFIDCEQGFKHVPVFADLIVRDFYDLKPVIGREGLVNIINILPTSYPGQSIITDDKAVIFGVDDCKCGRKGKYFKFTSRVVKSEARGCGDTRPEIR